MASLRRRTARSYFGGTALNRYIQNVIEEAFGPTPDFLATFKGYGWYLDDLVLTPVDKLGPIERRAQCVAARNDLAKRIAEYQPQAFTTFMRGIADDVEAAATRANSIAKRNVVSFPGQGNQARFRAEMKTIIPLLPKLSAK